MKKGFKLYSILNNKCPRCHQGDLFINKNPYKLDKMASMYEYCTNCGLKIEPETGFFYGAMYVSYGLTVAMGVSIYVAYYIFSLLFSFEINLALYLIITSLSFIVFGPLMFRKSRVIYMNIFIDYNPSEKGAFIKK